MATEEGTVSESVVKAAHSRDLLASRVGDDGRKDGRSEARVLCRVEAVEVEELEEEDEVRLRLGLCRLVGELHGKRGRSERTLVAVTAAWMALACFFSSIYWTRESRAMSSCSSACAHGRQCSARRPKEARGRTFRITRSSWSSLTVASTAGLVATACCWSLLSASVFSS